MPHDFMPGLAGIPAAKSAVSDVDGERGVLEYRGIRVEELCERSSFLETTYLLLFGRLPDEATLNKWQQDIIHHRRVKYSIIDLMKCLPEQGHPMDALQAAVAALGMYYPGRNVQDFDNNYWSAVRLVAKLPTIVAAWARLRRGDDAIPPRDELGFSDNFFYMLTEAIPPPVWADIFDDCLILHAEHTMNASTFTGLVTASTLADPYTVVASSIGALKGPLHGGANEEVVQMLKDIGSADQARHYVEEQVRKKKKLMGFGHRVYKVKDPRATILATSLRHALQNLRDVTALQHRFGGRAGRGRDAAGKSGLSECRFLFRHHLRQDGDRHRLVHAHFRDGPGVRMARPLAGTVAGKQVVSS